MKDKVTRSSRRNSATVVLFQVENADLCDKIHQERQVCIAIKVESRMMQQQHLESSAYSLDDCESLL
jgi:hypothetical protein